MQLFFILGKHPALSIAEILAVMPDLKIIKATDDILIAELTEKTETTKPADLFTAQNFDFNLLQNRLGGTIKIGQLWGNFEHIIINLIIGKITENHEAGRKLQYGFSLYPLGASNFIQEIKKQVKNLGIEIKNQLKKQNISSRFVTSKEPQLSSVVVSKNKLLTSGAEIIIAPDSNNTLWIGKTMSVQNFEEYSHLDYDRPAHDDLAGMIPPKLAQMMINLAQKPTDAIILDPFCGSGTILNQAVILGYKNIIGTDYSAKAIKDTEKNLSWLIREKQLITVHSQLHCLNVEFLSTIIAPKSVDAIITEPFLGPPQRGHENRDELKKTALELENLYTRALTEFKKVLQKNGRIVMILPLFLATNPPLFMQLESTIKRLRLKIIDPAGNLPENIVRHLSARNTLLYWREGQHVGREIIILEV